MEESIASEDLFRFVWFVGRRLWDYFFLLWRLNLFILKDLQLFLTILVGAIFKWSIRLQNLGKLVKFALTSPCPSLSLSSSEDSSLSFNKFPST
jgi:hypothetical protein